MAANTLIGLERPSQLRLRNQEIEKKERELKELRHRYFNAKTRTEKQRLQEKDRKIRQEIARLLINDGWNETTAKKIASFDLYDQNASADWFDPEWMFGVVDGFDIVIGNPPYVRQEKIKLIKPILEKQNYKVFTSTADLYVYFYEKGHQLLRDRGMLSYISSNKWMRAKYGEKLRNFLKNNAQILKIIDFSGYRVFEQTVDTNIILLRKANSTKEHQVNFVEIKSNLQDVIGYINQSWQTIPQEKLSDSAWTLADEKVLALKEKIEKVGTPLKDWDVRIYFGIKTGFNEAFIIDTETRNRILAKCKTQAERKRTEEIIKPVLRGKDIGRYYYKWAGLWIILAKFGFYKVAHLYPAIVEHLSKYEKQLKNRGQCRYTRGGEKQVKKDYEGQHHWLELDNNPTDEYLEEFEKEKVVWQRVTKKFTFCLVQKGIYILDSMAFMVGKDLKYILGILNSKLSDFYIKTYVHMYGDTGFLLSNQYVERIPLPPITPQNQPIVQKIETLVDQILAIKNHTPDADTRQLERQIDQLVYKLYGLTEEEIKIIER